MRNWLMILGVALSLSMVLGCEKEETPSQAIQDAADATEDAAKDAADKTEDAAEDAADAVKDATN